MISALVGATAVLGVSAVLNRPTMQSQSVADLGGSTQSRISEEAQARQIATVKAGTCLNWTKANADDIRTVPCSKPHLFEVTGIANLSSEFGSKATYPGRSKWQEIKKQYCLQLTKRYLGGDFDPQGRFKLGLLKPAKEGWNSGDRTVQCGLRQPGPTGRLFRFTGSVKRLDQSAVYPVGTCLGISGTSMSGPVPCSEPHAIEITGVVDLGRKFKKGYPKVAKQDDFLFDKCKKLTTAYAGKKKAAESEGLQVYWNNLSKKSWQAGSRKVNCKVSAELPGGDGLAPVTGSVKGKVTVGKNPAPNRPAPTAPVDGPR